MDSFFNFFSIYRDGILLVLLSLFLAVLLINWLAWIFNWGRFKEPHTGKSGQNLRYIFSDAVVKIINDFRHLLALIIVFIFAFVLVYAMIRAGGDGARMKDAIQVVVASLGGLVGSIIGYYFGESAVIKARAAEAASPAANDPAPAVQSGAPPLPGQNEPPIKEAPQPPRQT